ncbi:MAG: hypothetical protein HYY02_00915 [Chloroflexi bacterium]|nr:hypothetical protein [Chloroflexota bacterium]
MSKLNFPFDEIPERVLALCLTILIGVVLGSGIFLAGFASGVERWLTALGALFTGILGSVAYFTALFLGFVGQTEGRNQLLSSFRRANGSLSAPIVGAYVFVGGGIAVVFQIASPAFAPVQSLILGATWPAVLIQWLSSQQTGENKQQVSQKLGSARGLGSGNLGDAERLAQEARRQADELLR